MTLKLIILHIFTIKQFAKMLTFIDMSSALNLKKSFYTIFFIKYLIQISNTEVISFTNISLIQFC